MARKAPRKQDLSEFEANPAALGREEYALDVFGLVKDAKEHGIPSFGWVLTGLMVGLIVGTLVSLFGNPSVTYVDVAWSVKGQKALISPHQGRLVDFVIPPPTTAALGIWLNVSGSNCARAVHFGLEEGSSSWEPKVSPDEYPNDDDIIQSGHIDRYWIDENAVGSGLDEEDDLGSVLDATLKAPKKGGPFFMFPMLGRSALQVDCESGSVEMELRHSLTTGGIIYDKRGLYIPRVWKDSERITTQKLYAFGRGLYQYRLDPVVTLLSGEAVGSWSKGMITMEKFLDCSNSGGQTTSKACDQVGNRTIVRIETPEFVSMRVGQRQGGVVGALGSTVGLATGVLGVCQVVSMVLRDFLVSCSMQSREKGVRGLCCGLTPKWVVVYFGGVLVPITFVLLSYWFTVFGLLSAADFNKPSATTVVASMGGSTCLIAIGTIMPCVTRRFSDALLSYSAAFLTTATLIVSGVATLVIGNLANTAPFRALPIPLTILSIVYTLAAAQIDIDTIISNPPITYTSKRARLYGQRTARLNVFCAKSTCICCKTCQFSNDETTTRQSPLLPTEEQKP